MGNGPLLMIGAASFAALQVAWSLGHAYAGFRGAWIMKAGSGFAACFFAFMIVGAAVAAYRHRSGDVMRRVGSLIAGAACAMIVALLIIGPGSLWPLVVVLDSVVIGAGALIGAAIGGAIAKGEPA